MHLNTAENAGKIKNKQIPYEKASFFYELASKLSRRVPSLNVSTEPNDDLLKLLKMGQNLKKHSLQQINLCEKFLTSQIILTNKIKSSSYRSQRAT